MKHSNYRVISSKGETMGALYPYISIWAWTKDWSKVENGNGMGAQRGYYLTSGGPSVLRL